MVSCQVICSCPIEILNKQEILEVSLHVLVNDGLRSQNFYHSSGKCLWKETIIIVFITDVVVSRVDQENVSETCRAKITFGGKPRCVDVHFMRTNQPLDKIRILNTALSESRSAQVCTLIVSSGKNRPGWLSYNPSRILISCSVNENNFYMLVSLSLFMEKLPSLVICK